MARERTTRISIDIGDADPARIAVVADSHSRPHPRAHDWVKRLRPAAILHAGDIGQLGVLDDLEAIAPTHAIRGNIDGRSARTPDSMVIDVTRREQTALRIWMTHIAVAGPRLRKDARLRAREHGAGIVVCGHSHVPLIADDGGVAVFNPGSLGPRRFHLPITIGVIEVGLAGVSLRHIDCETGDLWLPPPM